MGISGSVPLAAILILENLPFALSLSKAKQARQAQGERDLWMPPSPTENCCAPRDLLANRVPTRRGLALPTLLQKRFCFGAFL